MITKAMKIYRLKSHDKDENIGYEYAVDKHVKYLQRFSEKVKFQVQSTCTHSSYLTVR